MRTDGVFALDVRATIRTDDVAQVYVSYGGLIDAGPDDYQWANRLVCIGIGELHFSVPEVRYDVYAVR